MFGHFWFGLVQGRNEPLIVVEPANLPKKIVSTSDDFGYKKLSDEWLALRERH